MKAVSASLRRAVWQRAGGHCEYCLIHENDILFAHEPDHVVAEQHGGSTTEANLALACADCNRRKGPNLASVDPESLEVIPLFHPRKDRWPEHFALHGARIVGRTPAGRATVFLLQLNSVERVWLRERLRRVGRYPEVTGS